MSGAEVVPASADGLAEFSYASLDADAAAVAQEAADIIRGIQKASVLEVGRQLLRAKDMLPHGAYEGWVRDVLGMKVRTAHNHLSAARWLDDKPATVADLPAGILYALAAPTAAAEVVQSVIAAAEAGEPLNAKDIDTRLDTAKREAAALKIAQKRNPTVTRERLAANKAKQDQRWKAQRDREEQEQARIRRDAEEQMQPLAAAILAYPGEVAVLLSDALVDYRQREALKALLDAGLREVAQ